MSLATKLTLLVMAILGVSGALAAAVFYDSVRRSLHAELEERLDVRLDWLERRIQVDDFVRLRAIEEPPDAAPCWRVERPDRRILWSSPRHPENVSAVSRSRTVSFQCDVEREERLPIDAIPRSVLQAVEDHIPGAVVRDARRTASVFRFDALLGSGSYDVMVEVRPSGEVRTIDFRTSRKEVRSQVDAPGEREDRKSPPDEETDVTLAELPAPVRASLARFLGGFPVDGGTRVGSGEDIVFRFGAESEGADVDLEVASDGTLLEKEVDIDQHESPIDLAELPAPVRGTIERELAGADVAIGTRLREGRLVYEVGATLGGYEVGLGLLDDGTVRSRRMEVDSTSLPPAVTRAIETALGDIPVERVVRVTAAGTSWFQVEADGGLRGFELQLTEDGSRVETDSSELQPRYRLEEGTSRLELTLTAVAPCTEAEAELRRLARTFWAVGPLALFACGAGLAFAIRWQLRPLHRIAEQASHVDPEHMHEPIEAGGTSGECARLRDALNAMLDRLREGLERERRFAASAAHELRTPLAELKASIEIALRRERDSSEYRETLAGALQDIERLEKLILGLLELARRSHRPGGERELVPLRAPLARALERCSQPQLSAPPSLDGVLVEGDTDFLERAFSNVLGNARKHAPGAVVELRLETHDGSVDLIFADRGPGVGEGDRERIFEPLGQVVPRRWHEGGSDGFGLGLTVARAAVRAFGGDLTCRSRSDGLSGAEFVFTLRKGAPAAEH